MVMSFVTERNLGAANIEMSSPNGENVKTLSPLLVMKCQRSRFPGKMAEISPDDTSKKCLVPMSCFAAGRLNGRLAERQLIPHVERPISLNDLHWLSKSKFRMKSNPAVAKLMKFK